MPTARGEGEGWRRGQRFQVGREPHPERRGGVHAQGNTSAQNAGWESSGIRFISWRHSSVAPVERRQNDSGAAPWKWQ